MLYRRCYFPIPLILTTIHLYILPKVRSDAMEAQPWEGLYWTTAVSRTQAAALHFWFEKLDTSAGIENSVPYARANGLQVRCVKQQGR